MKNHYKLWILLSFIIVFILGGVAGIFLNQSLFPEKEKKIIKEKHRACFPTLEIMAKELKLTPEQEESIRGIFRNNEEKLKSLKSLMHERISTIRSQLKEGIRNVLSEEQKTKFEAMIDRYLKQRKKEMDKRKKQRR
jgi:uncharacterized membrane protein YgaE (UPF0421/DUF939 family)